MYGFFFVRPFVCLKRARLTQVNRIVHFFLLLLFSSEFYYYHYYYELCWWTTQVIADTRKRKCSIIALTCEIPSECLKLEFMFSNALRYLLFYYVFGCAINMPSDNRYTGTQFQLVFWGIFVNLQRIDVSMFQFNNLIYLMSYILRFEFPDIGVDVETYFCNWIASDLWSVLFRCLAQGTILEQQTTNQWGHTAFSK